MKFVANFLLYKIHIQNFLLKYTVNTLSKINFNKPSPLPPPPKEGNGEEEGKKNLESFIRTSTYMTYLKKHNFCKVRPLFDALFTGLIFDLTLI